MCWIKKVDAWREQLLAETKSNKWIVFNVWLTNAP